MDIKNEVLIRVYTVLLLIVLFGTLILAKLIQIHFLEGEKWREKGERLYMEIRSIDAERGNILTEDGSMLATSLPVFDIAFDPNSSGMKESDFYNNIDSLAYCLATYVDNRYTVGGYREFLINKRVAGSEYVPIKRNVSYSDMIMMSKFPLFKLGQYRGGFITNAQYKRDRPFNLLARRTIGYVRGDSIKVGLEGFYNQQLKGQAGKQLMVCVEKEKETCKYWKPLDDITGIEPQRGQDIVTTIDINIQDITEQALYRALEYHDAKWGSAIVMEVETGAIRSIANLGKTNDGSYWETYNYAIGSATEPGSTYKLASIMALLEDGYISLEDSIDIENGKTSFFEEVILEDASIKSFTLDTISIKKAFEISSNVGITKLTHKYYGNNQKRAERFIEHLKRFRLSEATGIEIEGEVTPYIKEPYSLADQWSGITLPWMSMGYEVTATPLQLLAFYNAVANDGKWMKPHLVSEIQYFGETIEKIRPKVILPQIASDRTIQLAKSLLEGVINNGTAQELQTNLYDFAGKTGTTQINYQRLQKRTEIEGYQSSFVGYFPAKNPKYSCIVVVNDPKENGFYGGEVAGPVFRQIADNIHSSKIALHLELREYKKPALTATKLPNLDAGYSKEIAYIMERLAIPYYQPDLSDWIVSRATKSDSVQLLNRRIQIEKKTIPNVVGMGLRDALFILENKGLKVKVRGFGKVQLQSIKPGTPVKGQEITITLG